MRFYYPVLFVSFVLALFVSPMACARNPNDPSAPDVPPFNATLAKVNNARFAGEWLPEEYDVGRLPPYGTSSAKILWKSSKGKAAKREPRVWWEQVVRDGKPRPPGTFLLNMLTKNERDNLDRTLGKWAQVIDYWVIGIDDKNTDDSIDVIKKHLSHLPGAIVEVHFDGIGPTWTRLVDIGVSEFPGATHGIIADADYSPMISDFNRYDLDIRCSKHMYTIWTQDHRNERRMDWIYRNVPGAKVLRRTHQIVEVPPFPNQEVYQTMTSLKVDEREGGYGDRSGTKNQRYVQWLEADLLDYPNDTRTLYYLGYAHYDIYSNSLPNPTAEHTEHLHKGIEYFKRRGEIESGNKEERWFALLKLGEIHERFLRNWVEAEKFYVKCSLLDPVRADAWFYLGQHYRLSSEFARGEPLLRKAATLPLPDRALFQWHYLYDCLAKVEYGRVVVALSDKDEDSVKIKKLKKTSSLLHQAICNDGQEKNDKYTLLEKIEKKIKQRRKALQQKKEGAAKKKQEAEEKKKKQQAEAEEEAQEKAAKKAAKKDKKQEKKKKNKKNKKKQQKKASASDADTDADPQLSEMRAYVRGDGKLQTVRALLTFITDHADHLESQAAASRAEAEGEDESARATGLELDSGIDLYTQLLTYMEGLTHYLNEYKRLGDADADASEQLVARQYEYLNCHKYRVTVRPYATFMKKYEQPLYKLINDKSLAKEWKKYNTALTELCR